MYLTQINYLCARLNSYPKRDNYGWSINEDNRSIICRQQHQDIGKAETGLPGVRLHRKVERGEILTYQYAVQQQQAGQDFIHAGKDHACEPLSYKQVMVSGGPSGIRLCEDVHDITAEALADNQELHKPVT